MSGNSPKFEVMHPPRAHNVHMCAPGLSNRMGGGDLHWRGLS